MAYVTARYKNKELKRIEISHKLQVDKFITEREKSKRDEFIQLLELAMAENDTTKKLFIEKLAELEVFIENVLPVNIFGDKDGNDWVTVATPIIYRKATEISAQIDFIIIHYSYIFGNIVDKLKRIKDDINDAIMTVSNEIDNRELTEDEQDEIILNEAEHVYKIIYKISDCREEAVEAYNFHRKKMSEYVDRYLEQINLTNDPATT